MNTVFLVKNAAYQFLIPPQTINMDWLHKLLESNNLTIKKLHKNICVIHSSHNKKKYKLSISNKLTINVPNNFILAQFNNDQLATLSEQQEDYIIETINIKIYN